MELVLQPTKENLKEIENWLIDEKNKYNTGFYCNWKKINTHFEEGYLYCFSEKNKLIGFVC